MVVMIGLNFGGQLPSEEVEEAVVALVAGSFLLSLD